MFLTLTGKKEEVSNVISFFFKADSALNWEPGQYFHYFLDDTNRGVKVDRYFSIASAPFEEKIMLTTRFSQDISVFKKDLRHLNIGDRVEAKGPMGWFGVDDPLKEYVFLAGGIGITAFRSILLDLNHRNLPINVTLLYANRNKDIIFKDELEAIANKHPTFKIHYVIDPERIDEAKIRSLVSDYLNPSYYLSGPEPMVETFVPLLLGMGVSNDKIKLDFFPGYAGI